MTEQFWDEDVDVVVVGYGVAGCAAAIEAHDSGAEVIVLEKMPAGREGGNTRITGGAWPLSADWELLGTYLRNLCAHNPIPEATVRVWIDEIPHNTDWVTSLGGEVMTIPKGPEFPDVVGSAAFGGQQCIAPWMGDARLWQTLSAAVEERGVRVLRDTRAVDLVRDESDAVVGLVAESTGGPLRLRARGGVVLAAGGFHANARMVRDYLGLSAPVYLGSPGSTGDGITLGQSVGADLSAITNFNPCAGFRPDGFEAGFEIRVRDIMQGAFLYTGLDGHRFHDETVPGGHGHANIHGRLALFPDRPMFVIFDEQGRAAGPLGRSIGHFGAEWARQMARDSGKETADLESWTDKHWTWNILIEGYHWSADNRAEIEKGWIKQGDDPEELAMALGVDPATLSRTIAGYNEACATGADPLGRAPEMMVPLNRPPYYAFRSEPMIFFTIGGLRRNERSEILHVSGEPIAGLYGAGENAASYSWAVDSGFMIADAMAFGRIAGRNAAARRASSSVTSGSLGR